MVIEIGQQKLEEGDTPFQEGDSNPTNSAAEIVRNSADFHEQMGVIDIFESRLAKIRLEIPFYLKHITAPVQFISESAAYEKALRRLCELINQAPYLPTVFIDGKTGTGKTTLAYWMHQNDQNKKGHPVIVIEKIVPEINKIEKLIELTKFHPRSTLLFENIDSLGKSELAALLSYLEQIQNDMESVPRMLRPRLVLTGDSQILKYRISDGELNRGVIDELPAIDLTFLAPWNQTPPEQKEALIAHFWQRLNREYHTDIVLPERKMKILFKENFENNIHGLKMAALKLFAAEMRKSM